MEERPWPDWYGKQISASSVAKLLKPFGIVPKQFKDSGKKERGYLKTFFIEPISRYQNGTAGTDLKNNGLGEFPNGTEGEEVSDKKFMNSFKNNLVPGVPGKSRLLEGEKEKITQNKDSGNDGNSLWEATI